LKRRQSNHEFWRTTPIGTISFVDKHDLPLEEHHARARKIVARGSEFAAVVSLEHSDVQVFRMSGVTRHRHPEKFRLPEWPWFDVPIQAAWTE
jgi:hypothetical protein